MARKKFQTLTEQMYYILLALTNECCGVDITERVKEITHGRIRTDKLNYVTTAQASTLYKVYDDFNSGNFSRMLLEEAYDEYVKVYGKDMNFVQFRESISKYAVSKDSTGSYIYDETIAEAFHDCYLNGSKAKPASRMIMKVLDTKL